ncbi:murein hydrolase activator EnvC family protein [Asticcacaulis solisilvae]|uniref:murein hydrolase activator EnvC family protein n=1 Tax=Asticcacaulis solisilvae TaxID=1217274 RepID=UPI003FD77412
MFGKFVSRGLKIAVLPALLVTGLLMTLPVHAQTTCAGAALSPAVEGHVVVGFGETNPADSTGAGLHSRGIVYATAGRASVTAPADGKVEFAGRVPNLGQVVILDIGDNYRVVLTGLDRLSVRTGQRVEAEDYLGAMPGIGHQTAHLYVELRCGEEPVNPVQTLTVAMR